MPVIRTIPVVTPDFVTPIRNQIKANFHLFKASAMLACAAKVIEATSKWPWSIRMARGGICGLALSGFLHNYTLLNIDVTDAHVQNPRLLRLARQVAALGTFFSVLDTAIWFNDLPSIGLGTVATCLWLQSSYFIRSYLSPSVQE